MKECCETGEPKKRRKDWHWFALGGVVAIAAGLQLIPRPIICGTGCWTDKSRADIVAIQHALDEYAINNNGAYPPTLQPLVLPDENGNSYLEGYNGKPPRDAWKREYHYEVPTAAYPRPHVWSYGADGKLGGTGDDADIDSEAMRSEKE